MVMRGRVGVVVLAMMCAGLAPRLAQPPAGPGDRNLLRRT